MNHYRLRCGWPGVLFVSVWLLVFAVCCSLAFAQSANNAPAEAGPATHYSYAELEKAPENARMRSNPLEGDSNAVAAGRKLFGQHCALCHGKTGDGGRKGPSLRAPEVRDATPGMLFWILTEGVVRRGMPVWSKLPEQQRWQIVCYLKSLD
ncbi:MAG TPA: cytochrome c [Candidatus Angelobacter sp.]